MRNLLFLSLFFAHSLAASEWKDWFSKSKTKRGKNCVLDCATAKVDLGSFTCPVQCPDLCKSPLPDKLLFKLSDLYPGLTNAEKAMDLANNRLGIIEGENLGKKSDFSEESLLNSFDENLKRGNLITIQTRKSEEK